MSISRISILMCHSIAPVCKPRGCRDRNLSSVLFAQSIDPLLTTVCVFEALGKANGAVAFRTSRLPIINGPAIGVNLPVTAIFKDVSQLLFRSIAADI